MKAMVCEMCNGNDLVKQDGMFVCQHCGTKYSIEEAKKLMIEGTVDVQGTVKVDNTDAVEKYLINARRAKQKEDWKEAERYYNLVEQDDPSNIEAIFYSAYASAKQSLVENDIFKRKAVFNSFNKSVSIIDDYYDVKNENSFSLLCQITDDIFALVNSSFTYTKTTKNNMTTDNSNETYALFHDLIISYANTLYAIEPKYGEDKEGRLKIFRLIMHCFKTAFSSTSDASKKIMWHNNCITCSGHIKALDPAYDDSFLEAQRKSIKTTQRANTIGLIAGIAVFGVIIGLIVFFVTM